MFKTVWNSSWKYKNMPPHTASVHQDTQFVNILQCRSQFHDTLLQKSHHWHQDWLVKRCGAFPRPSRIVSIADMNAQSHNHKNEQNSEEIAIFLNYRRLSADLGREASCEVTTRVQSKPIFDSHSLNMSTVKRSHLPTITVKDRKILNRPISHISLSQCFNTCSSVLSAHSQDGWTFSTSGIYSRSSNLSCPIAAARFIQFSSM